MPIDWNVADVVNVVPVSVSNVPLPSRSHSYFTIELSALDPTALSATACPTSATVGVAEIAGCGARCTISWWPMMREAPWSSVTRRRTLYVPAVSYDRWVLADVPDTSKVPLPSRSHAYLTMSPSSVDAAPLNFTTSPFPRAWMSPGGTKCTPLPLATVSRCSLATAGLGEIVNRGTGAMFVGSPLPPPTGCAPAGCAATSIAMATSRSPKAIVIARRVVLLMRDEVLMTAS